MTQRVLFFLAAILIAPSAMAVEYVVMKNGDRVTGDVKQIWNGEVFIEPEYGDEYAIDLDYVAYVHSDEAFDVDVRMGRRVESVVGTLGQAASGEAGVLADSGELLYPLSQIDNIQEFDEYFDWEFRTDLSVNFSEGNTDASSSRLGVYVDLTVGDHDHKLSLTRDEQRTNDTLTKDQTQIRYQDSWTFHDRWFIRGGADWTRDPIRQLDSRIRIFVGPGYHFYDDSRRQLNLSVGPAWLKEEIGDDNQRSSAARASLNYEQRFLANDLVVFQNTNYTRIFGGRENKLLEMAAGIRYEITDDIYASMQGTYDHESNPAADQKQEDITYLIGVGIQLD